jgi:hypothetical protein
LPAVLRSGAGGGGGGGGGGEEEAAAGAVRAGAAGRGGPPAPRFGLVEGRDQSPEAWILPQERRPYSENTAVTEYFDRHTETNGDEWFTVTTLVDDSKYLNQTFITSSGFKKESDGAKWRATSCAAQ